jgi:hypothetical protein
MKLLKKFWLGFLAAMPLSAGAVTPLVIGGAAVGVGIIGVSIWRTVSPVNISEALDFFTSCWTCQIFSDIMVSMSNLLPGIYTALGRIIIPMSISLLAVLIAWRLMSDFINAKSNDGTKLIGNFGTYIVKFAILMGLLLAPLPRVITSVLIEPAMTIGTSLDYIVSDNNKFSECMVATALSDPMVVSKETSAYGAFSPKLRHQLACEVANIHQITGLGMTVGWTMLNMSFNKDYMHKIFGVVPIFPNVPVMVVGLLILVLYFFALLPIPVYFLEVFIKLSLDLVMLPLMLMAWMFDEDGFAIFPQGGRTIKQMIEDVIKAVVGIALTVVFLTFSIMFLNALFEDANGINALQQAIAQNDSKIFMDGLTLRDSSLILVVLIGIFIAMFMTMIPQLTNMFFKIKISDDYYQKIKKDLGFVWNGIKSIIPGDKKSESASSGGGSSASGFLSNIFNPADSNEHKLWRELEYIESSGTQYIDIGLTADDDIRIDIKVQPKSGNNTFLFGGRDNDQYNSFALEVFPNGKSDSVYVEYGTTSQTLDCNHSLTTKAVRINMFTDNFSGSKTVAIDYKMFDFPKQSFSASNNIFLFGLNDRGIFTAGTTCRLYRCEIFKNGRRVRDLFAALDENDVPCLYDTIGKRFYRNKGYGQFTAGPLISKNLFKSVSD